LKQNLLFLFLLSILPYCKNKELQAIAQLEIDQFTSAYPNNSDTLGNQNITDVWILTANEDLGAYELPAKVPIKANGDSILVLMSPGLKFDDNPSIRYKYPVLSAYSVKLKLEAGKKYKIIPKISYFSTYKVDIENFEGTGVKLDKLNSKDTTLIVENLSAHTLNGSKYGRIALTSAYSQMGLRTSNKFKLPIGNSQDRAFLEFNYKSDVKITIGLYDGGTGYTPIVERSANSNWTKYYLDLSSASKAANYANGSFIYFAARHSDGLAISNIYLEDIKIITRK
jgi:hypothetical protein